MRLFNIIFVIIIVVFIVSCKANNNQWIGKKILFPNEIIFTRYLTDTLNYSISDSKFKIVLSVDSNGCTGCKLQLDRWKEYISYMDTIASNNICFLFFIQSKNLEEFKYILINEEFEYPLCIDTKGIFAYINHIWGDEVFLIDENNRIIATGNPTQDVLVEKTYFKLITKCLGTHSKKLGIME